MTSLPAAASSSDCRRRSHPDCRATAFDLIELNGDDLRLRRLEDRKAALARIVAAAASGLQLNDHMPGHGPAVFEQACKLGLEGIVSKRKDLHYISGRCRHWIKSKNPNAPAVKREAGIDWGRRR